MIQYGMKLETSYYTALGQIPPQGIQMRFCREEDFISTPHPDDRHATHKDLAAEDKLSLEDNYTNKRRKDAGFITFLQKREILISGRSSHFDVPLESVAEEVRAETGRQVGEIFPDFTIICGM